jgi:acetyl-CoA acetyltransferase
VERQRHGAGQLRPARHRLHDRARRVGEDLKKAIGHVSWKSHQNGAKNPKAHLQKAVEMDTILNAPMIASPLGLFDCCGVSDGAAAAIVTTPEIAKALGKQNIVSVKALQLSGLQRLGVGPQLVGRQLLPHHAHRLEEGL